MHYKRRSSFTLHCTNYAIESVRMQSWKASHRRISKWERISQEHAKREKQTNTSVCIHNIMCAEFNLKATTDANRFIRRISENWRWTENFLRSWYFSNGNHSTIINEKDIIPSLNKAVVISIRSWDDFGSVGILRTETSFHKCKTGMSLYTCKCKNFYLRCFKRFL